MIPKEDSVAAATRMCRTLSNMAQRVFATIALHVTKPGHSSYLASWHITDAMPELSGMDCVSGSLGEQIKDELISAGLIQELPNLGCRYELTGSAWKALLESVQARAAHAQRMDIRGGRRGLQILCDLATTLGYEDLEISIDEVEEVTVRGYAADGHTTPDDHWTGTARRLAHRPPGDDGPLWLWQSIVADVVSTQDNSATLGCSYWLSPAAGVMVQVEAGEEVDRYPIFSNDDLQRLEAEAISALRQARVALLRRAAVMQPDTTPAEASVIDKVASVLADLTKE